MMIRYLCQNCQSSVKPGRLLPSKRAHGTCSGCGCCGALVGYQTSQFEQALNLIRTKPIWFEGEQVELDRSDPYRFTLERKGGYIRLALKIGVQQAGNSFTVGIQNEQGLFEPYTLQGEAQYRAWSQQTKEAAGGARQLHDSMTARFKDALWVRETKTRPPEPAKADDILSKAKSDIQQVVDGLPPEILEEMEKY